jgi:hypothetical protein
MLEWSMLTGRIAIWLSPVRSIPIHIVFRFTNNGW